MAASPFVEFYVACNPPLLPKGVKGILDLATTEFRPDVLLEILYEPEIPWVKCISDLAQQDKVTTFIQNHLTKILEHETTPIDLDHEDENSEDIEAQTDVVIVAANPQVIPWSSYATRLCNLHSSNYDAFRFPVSLSHMAYKTIWRGIEQHDPWTAQKLCDRISSLGRASDVPTTFEQFQKLMNCEVSYNLSGTVVYLGSNESMAAVNKVVKVLSTLLDCLHQQPPTGSHLILTEGKGSFKICYRWLSHLGLSHSTFVQADAQALANEYRLLTNAASLRSERRTSKGIWVSDSTTYQNTQLSRPHRPFSVFDGYTFPMKRPASVIEAANVPLSQRKALRTLRNIPSTSPGRPWRHTENTGISKPSHVLAPSPAFILPRMQAPVSTVAPASGKSTGEFQSVASTKLSSQSRVFDWVNETDSARPVRPISPSIADPFLISLDQPESSLSNTAIEERNASQARTFNETRIRESMKDKNVEFGDNLISFEEEEDSSLTLASSGDHANLPSQEVTGTDNSDPFWTGQLRATLESYRHRQPEATRKNEHLLDSSVPPIISPTLLGQGSPGCAQSLNPRYPAIASEEQFMENDRDNSVAMFGIHREDSPGIFWTMHQRAGRPSPFRNRPGNNNAAKTPTKSTPNGSKVPTGMTKDHSTQWPALLGQAKPLTTAPGAKLPYTAAMKAFVPNNSAKSQSSRRMPKVSDLAPPVQMMRTVPEAPKRSLPPTQPRVSGLEVSPALNEDEGATSWPDRLALLDGVKKSDILEQTESRVRSLTSILRVAQGYVSLELKFGRIYFKELRESAVSNGSGPSHPVDAFLEALHDVKRLNPERIKFSPVLSTHGSDADALISMCPLGEPKWELFRTQTIYEFTCYLDVDEDDGGPFRVEMNADKIDNKHLYVCRGPKSEISSLLLHCTHRAWDMKVSAARSDCFPSGSRPQKFAKSLVDSVAISTNKAGHLTIEATEDERFGAVIDSVRIRQSAEYRNKKTGGSMLTVNMFRTVRKSLDFYKNDKTAFRGICNLSNPDLDVESPSLWFEASISSVRAKELFTENIRLPFGDSTSWGCEHLEADGVFEDICRPALGMITRMDGIGSANNNGQGLQIQNTNCTTLPQKKNRDTGETYAFW